MTAVQLPLDLAQPLLQNLLVLVLNRIAHSSAAVLSIAKGEVLPLLVHLYLNVNKLGCTSFQTNKDQGRLESIYRDLASFSRYNRLRPHLNLYIHGVLLDLTRPFADYHFDRTLIVQHFRNRENGLAVQPCHSVSSTNFADVVTTYGFGRSDAAEAAANPLDAANERYARFHELYPCVQVVKLICPLGLHPIPDVFFYFLHTCKGLTELEIRSSVFSNAFYDRLITVPSCQTLRILTLFSLRGEVDKHIDFGFLTGFTFLRQFHTNRATRANMVQVVENGLTVGQEVRFSFSKHYLTVHVIRIWKISDDTYKLVVLEWKHNSSVYTEGSTQGSLTLPALLDYIQGAEADEFTRHWLDDLPVPEG